MGAISNFRIVLFFIFQFSIFNSFAQDGPNILYNGDFSNGTAYWEGLSAFPDASCPNNNPVASGSVVNGEYKVNIQATGCKEWSVQLKSQGYGITAGKWYKLQFSAYADSDRVIRPVVGMAVAPFTTFGHFDTIRLSTAKVTWDFVFKAETTYLNTRISIDMGAYSTADVTLDNFYLGETTDSLLVHYGTMMDIENNEYYSVKIGEQIWMKENLRTTTYNNGVPIPNLTSTTSWATTSKGVYCSYKNTANADTITKYGLLYNWYAVNSFKLCPVGWRMPNQQDWNKLIDYVGDTSNAGNALKASGNDFWGAPNNGALNSSGFTALPAGSRTNNGSMIDMGSTAYFWWADAFSRFDSSSALYSSLSHLGSEIFKYRAARIQGMSVRCIKGTAVNTVADFNIKVDNTTKTVTLNDSSNAPIVLWDLGNSTVSAEKNPVATYVNGGYYRITENILDTNANVIVQKERLININDGTKDCEAEFTYSVNDIYKMVSFKEASFGTGITSYVWDFGDNITATGATTSHTYSKDDHMQVCLSIVSSTCKNITCKQIKTGSDPKKLYADFLFVTDPTKNKVYFNDKSAGVKSWKWMFGDGQISVEQHPTHVYADTGLYHVILETTDPSGKIDIAHELVNVHSKQKTMKAVFVPLDVNATSKGLLPIEFKGAGYGDAAEVEWDFGDGETNASSLSPIHSYTTSGKYYVCMTIRDSLLGQEDTYCDSVAVGLTGINKVLRSSVSSEFEMWPNPIQSKAQSLTLRLAQGDKNVYVSSSVGTANVSRTDDVNTSRYSSLHSPLDVTITNTLGQVVLSYDLRLSTYDYQIDVSQFESGVYFVRVGNSVKKLIVNN